MQVSNFPWHIREFFIAYQSSVPCAGAHHIQSSHWRDDFNYFLPPLTRPFFSAANRREMISEIHGGNRRSDDSLLFFEETISGGVAKETIDFIITPENNTTSDGGVKAQKRQIDGTRRYIAAGSIIAYAGQNYAALDGWSPTDEDTSGCQSSYLSLPDGWSIAQNNANSISVIASYPWGTDLMVLADGSQFYTRNSRYSGMAGQSRTWYCCSDGATALGQSTDSYGNAQYRVNACARRILIINSCQPGTFIQGAD
jgi:hypothetical protein